MGRPAAVVRPAAVRPAAAALAVLLVGVVAALGGAAPAHAGLPGPPPPTPTGYGTLVVRSVAVAGPARDFSGITIQARDTEYPADVGTFTGTTDGDGSLTFTHVPNGTFAVTMTHTPNEDLGTYALSATSGVVVTPDTTTTATLPLRYGGSASGTIIGPDGAPLAGRPVTAYSGDTFPPLTTTTDGTGHYRFVGLHAAIYRLDASLTATSTWATEWKVRGVPQTATTDAVQTRVPTQMVHSTYDLFVGVETPRSQAAISGATIRATNLATGATYDQRTSFVTDSAQDVQFVIPSGTYSLQLITRATAVRGSETWWFRQWNTDDRVMTLDPAKAGKLVVRYGGIATQVGSIPGY